MHKPYLAIITPALAKANNGNWRTASRWASFLGSRYRTVVSDRWSVENPPGSVAPDAMIALHARRSAESITAFRTAHPGRPIVVVLTGTDIYRDIRYDPAARLSLDLATTLVVLQEAALQELEPELQAKTSVIYQSAPALRPPRWRSHRYFDVAMVGHLRSEKDPLTFIRAASLVQSPRVRMVHIGAILDTLLETEILQAERGAGRYRWLGALPHPMARQRLKRCGLMAITSRMEGGANAIIEAITSGVPVAASDIPGNRGMLGNDYAGYFPVGDAAALAALIDRAESDKAFLDRLAAQCNLRAPLFAPEREEAAVLQLMDNLVSR